MKEAKLVPKEKCSSCKYSMCMSTGSYESHGKWHGYSRACNYLDIEKKSRVFKDGKHRAGYEPGQCDVYVPMKKK